MSDENFEAQFAPEDAETMKPSVFKKYIENSGGMRLMTIESVGYTIHLYRVEKPADEFLVVYEFPIGDSSLVINKRVKAEDNLNSTSISLSREIIDTVEQDIKENS